MFVSYIDHLIMGARRGWLSVTTTSAATQEWIKTTMKNTRKKNVKAILPLHNSSVITVLYSTLKGSAVAPVSTTNIN